MATLKQLRDAAKELHDVMNLDELLAADAYYAEAKKYIREAAEFIAPDDTFSDATQKVIDAVLDETPDAPMLEENEAVDDLNETAPEDDMPEGDIKAILLDGIADAKTMAELKDIVKYQDIFAPMRNEMTKYKSKDALREAMLAFLNNAPEPEAPVEEAPVETVEETVAATVIEKAPVIEKPKPEKKKVSAPEKHAEKSAKDETSEEGDVLLKGDTFTRIDAVCEALKLLKPQTIDEWCTVADELYAKRGGKLNMKQSRRRVNQAINVLRNFEIDFPHE